MRNNKSKKSIEETYTYIERIRFKKIQTNRENAFDKLQARINNSSKVKYWLPVYWKYAACVALLLFILVSTYSISIYRNTKVDNYIEVKAIAGSKSRIVLPDSSVVWLNSNAWIRYPQHFTGNYRNVEFKGEGLFEVHKQTEPFFVTIDGLIIKVLGTTFNIYSNESSDSIEITLQKGKIALFKNDFVTSKADIILLPNDQVIFNKNNSEFELKKVSASLFASWSHGQFVFENNTLTEIITILERSFDTQIHLKNKKLGERRFTGQFLNGETLEEILSILQVPAQYSYKKEKGEYYINGI